MSQVLDITSPAQPFRPPLRANKSTMAYSALVFFSCYYYLRPEDFIPGLNIIPLGKIAGGIALAALIFAVKPKDRGKLPPECKVLLVLLAHLILTIPFAYWRGGAFDTVINKFSKGPIVALLIAMAVTQVFQLRKLLFIQAGSVALVTVVSLIARHTQDGRLMGLQKGILENPNDLAINIAINIPLCLAFLFAARGGFRKVLWAFALVAMMYAVVATYSRSGMVATVITSLICLWEFGVKGKRTLFLMSTGLIAMLALGIMLFTPRYLIRLESLYKGNIEGSEDHGSLEARSELLKKSIWLTVHHPIFGIGPGNFPAVTGEWRVAHNTYTELSAEGGLPALFLFLALLIMSLRKIRGVRKLPGYARDTSIRLWTSALWAAMAAYLAGAAFASTEYNLFPYFMVGYICALYEIAKKPDEPTDSSKNATKNGGQKELGYGGNREREFAWSR
jgi:O-antigen ligase